MKRLVLAATTLAPGMSIALAESPIAARQALMKKNGDAAKAKAIFAAYADAAAKMPALFPADSKTGEKTEALPVIWDKMDDFKAKFEKFGADAKDAQAKVTDEATFKAIFPVVQKNCGGCHQTYRVKKPS
jgi:cytochrome c556